MALTASRAIAALSRFGIRQTKMRATISLPGPRVHDRRDRLHVVGESQFRIAPFALAAGEPEHARAPARRSGSAAGIDLGAGAGSFDREGPKSSLTSPRAGSHVGSGIPSEAWDRPVRSAVSDREISEDFETFSVKNFGRHQGPIPSQPILIAALARGHAPARGPRGRRRDPDWLSADDVKTSRRSCTRGVPARRSSRASSSAESRHEKVRAMARLRSTPISTCRCTPRFFFHEWLGREGRSRQCGRRGARATARRRGGRCPTRSSTRLIDARLARAVPRAPAALRRERCHDTGDRPAALAFDARQASRGTSRRADARAGLGVLWRLSAWRQVARSEPKASEDQGQEHASFRGPVGADHGAASGIGRATVQRIASRGRARLLRRRAGRAVEAAAKDAASLGVDSEARVCDVSDESLGERDRRRVRGALRQARRALHVAGILRFAHAHEMTLRSGARSSRSTPTDVPSVPRRAAASARLEGQHRERVVGRGEGGGSRTGSAYARVEGRCSRHEDARVEYGKRGVRVNSVCRARSRPRLSRAEPACRRTPTGKLVARQMALRHPARPETVGQPDRIPRVR